MNHHTEENLSVGTKHQTPPTKLSTIPSREGKEISISPGPSLSHGTGSPPSAGSPMILDEDPVILALPFQMKSTQKVKYFINKGHELLRDHPPGFASPSPFASLTPTLEIIETVDSSTGDLLI